MPTDAEHAPFLFLSIRGEDAAADDEYQAMMRFGGLDQNGMQRIRLTHRSLGAVDLDDWSGIILGGGPYNASDPPDSKSSTQRRVEAELLSLIDRIVAADFPFLGCCYGVGMLGSVIGATVDRSYPEPVAAVTVTLTPAGREEPLFAELPDVFDAFGGHKEAASALPSAAVCLASSPDCPVQATRVTDDMMRVAAATLGGASPALSDPAAPLLPAWSDVPDIAQDIAHAVGRQAIAEGVAPARSDEQLADRIRQVHWTPEYPA